jgi:biotin carboxyl carrier protein
MSETFYLRRVEALDGPPQMVTVEALDGERFRVTVQGVVHEVSLLHWARGALSFQLGVDSVTVSMHSREKNVTLSGFGGQHTFQVHDERTERLRAAAGPHSADGLQEIRSPMPGKVVKLLVKPGDEVTRGQGVVVVEAMKMENELKSPKAGKVVTVSTAEGAVVETGALLVKVE